MFTTELRWAEKPETVGARRERKARERSTPAGSINTSTSSRSSVSTERELWWTTGLKKAKNLGQNIRRPSTSRSSTSSQQRANAVPSKLDVRKAREFKDPALQPGWTISSSLSPTLPSGDPLYVHESDVPELDGDMSSRRTVSTRSRFSHDRQWEVKTPTTIDSSDDRYHRPRNSPGSIFTNTTRTGSVVFDHEVTSPKITGTDAQPVDDEKALSLEALELRDSFHKSGSFTKARQSSVGKTSTSLKLSPVPFLQWQSLSPRGVPSEIQAQSESTSKNVAIAHSSTVELTRFQRFIRRMEGAGPKVILDRLKEDWQEATEVEVDEELALEKQLWLLTGFQMQNFGRDRIIPKPECSTGRILELYGNLSEVYQLSAMHPSETVHFLTTKPQRPIPLPGNVSYLTVREFGVVPLPYPGDYFSHIRASTLPSLVPSARLPDLFSECYKLLAPGGFMEIRLMDATPVRKTAGPLMRVWIEDRLSVNLERLFRCSKPCLLVPGWLKEAGFDLGTLEVEQNVALPCAFDPSSANIDEELSTIIGRSFWRDIWGSLTDNAPEQPRWWWEDEEIVQECLRRRTVFECRTIYAYKR